MDRLEKLFNSKGFSVKKIYCFEKSVVFFDIGFMMIYVPSDIVLPQPRDDRRVVAIQPNDSEDTPYSPQFKQLERILERCPTRATTTAGAAARVTDVTRLQGCLFYCVGRKRCWKSAHRNLSSIRIALDLDEFIKSKWTKSKAKDSLLEVLCGMDVIDVLDQRKNEYMQYIKEVAKESDSLARDASQITHVIQGLRDRCKQNKSFVSVDVDLVHKMAQKESLLLDYRKKQKLAKSMFKTAMANFAKFIIEAEQSTHELDEAEKTMKKAMASIDAMA
ncbi:MAG: hypothetical protein K0U52_10355 [Gammaproteobacteria bacterium]|jgi:septal ring factor EnvC (AmiA/AmiB activator)|nr:hypothetical protein [Gammaproteobacteria bacterium]